jgi:hypothetical protein
MASMDTGTTDEAITVAVATTVMVHMADVALMLAAVRTADITDAVALTAADAGLAAQVAAETSKRVVVAASTAVVVVADSTAAVAADSTVVADMAVEAIAKT